MKQRNQNFKYGYVSMLCIFLILSTLFIPVSVFAGVTLEKTVTLASPSIKAMKTSSKYMEMHQYTYEYLKMVSNYADWKIKIVYADSDNLKEANKQCIDMVESGKADLLGGLMDTDEVISNFLYATNSYITVHTVLLAKQNNLYLHKTNLNMQEPLTVAVIESENERNFETRGFLESQRIDYDFIYCSNYESQLSALNNGKADVMIGIDSEPISGMKQVAEYADRQAYFATSKSNKTIIKELDAAIETINQVLPSFQSNLFQKFFTIPQNKIILSKSQKNYVKNHKSVRVLFNIEAPPFQFKDKNGKIIGLFVDVLKNVSNNTGQKFEYVEPEKGLTVQEMIESGHCDMVLAMPMTSEWVETYGIVHLRCYYFSESILRMIL